MKRLFYAPLFKRIHFALVLTLMTLGGCARHRAIVSLPTSMAIPSGPQGSPISFTTIESDPQNLFGAAAPTGLTVRRAGDYIVSLQNVPWPVSNPASAYELYVIRRRGSAQQTVAVESDVLTGLGLHQGLSCFVPAQSGDIFEAWVRHNGPSTVNILGSPAGPIRFGIAEQ